MKLRTDLVEYMKRQEVFTGEMIARIADHLEAAGVKGEQLKELTGKIAFEVTCMIDDELIHLSGNSTSHEMVYGILNAMFKNT